MKSLIKNKKGSEGPNLLDWRIGKQGKVVSILCFQNVKKANHLSILFLKKEKRSRISFLLCLNKLDKQHEIFNYTYVHENNDFMLLSSCRYHLKFFLRVL